MELHSAQAANLLQGFVRAEQSFCSAWNLQLCHWTQINLLPTQKAERPFCYFLTISWRKEETGKTSAWSLCPFTHIPLLFHFKEILITRSLWGKTAHALHLKTLCNKFFVVGLTDMAWTVPGSAHLLMRSSVCSGDSCWHFRKKNYPGQKLPSTTSFCLKTIHKEQCEVQNRYSRAPAAAATPSQCTNRKQPVVPTTRRSCVSSDI